VSKLLELEGTWEEIVAYSKKLAGHRVRVIVLPDKPQSSSTETPTSLIHSTPESISKRVKLRFN
jgi:hypothetical protein